MKDRLDERLEGKRIKSIEVEGNKLVSIQLEHCGIIITGDITGDLVVIDETYDYELEKDIPIETRKYYEAIYRLGEYSWEYLPACRHCGRSTYRHKDDCPVSALEELIKAMRSTNENDNS